MKLLDGLLGRTSPVRSREERLVALAGAVVSLEADLGLVPAGQGGLVLRHLDSAAFQRAEVKLAAILELAGRETGAEIVQERDSYGYHWVVVTDDAIADLVSTVYSVTLELRDAGFGDQVLAAAFGFRGADGRPIYWLYNFKRASFYPFAPTADGETRDNAREIQAAAAMERELPIEADQSRWYPMWGMPLDGAPSGRPASADAASAPDPKPEHAAHGEHAALNDDGHRQTATDGTGRAETHTDQAEHSSHSC